MNRVRDGQLVVHESASGDSLVIVHEHFEQPKEKGRIRLSVNSQGDVKIEKGDASTIDVPHNSSNATRFRAVLGIYELLAGPYLAVVTEVSRVGAAPRGQEICRIEKVAFLPVSSAAQQALNPTMRRDEHRFLSLLQEVVKSRALFFSYAADLTHTMQRLSETKESSSVVPDARFFWNRLALKPFHEQINTAVLDYWFPVVMCGFVEIQDQVDIAGNKFRMLVVSRRSVERQGKRLHVRGADQSGAVANFAETEQIAVFPDGRINSFVQIRGSIPLYWQQVPTLKYTPKVELTGEPASQALVLNKHLTKQIASYGDIIVVNLIDKKKDQLMLGALYEEYCAKMNDSRVSHFWFDFHHECKKMKYENLSRLFNQIGEPAFEKMGYFSVDGSGQVQRKQTAVIRTNCIDNLDRTNVAQSLFARKSVLAQFGKSSQSVLNSPFPTFEYMFKHAWANNADVMSLLYSGSGALKTDFTRTGKRTVMGALMDGYNSVKRYYLNNFRDGDAQDAFDLFLGKFEPAATYVKGQENMYQSPFREEELFSGQSPVFFIRLLFIIVTVLLCLATQKKFDGRQYTNRPHFVRYALPPVQVPAQFAAHPKPGVAVKIMKKHTSPTAQAYGGKSNV